MPVCGNALDVAPAACCQRHAPCPQDPGNPDYPHDPVQCCNRGEHTYPAARLQSPLITLAPAWLVALWDHIGQPILTADARRYSGDFASTLLKIPLRPLYMLTATYRI